MKIKRLTCITIILIAMVLVLLGLLAKSFYYTENGFKFKGTYICSDDGNNVDFDNVVYPDYITTIEDNKVYIIYQSRYYVTAKLVKTDDSNIYSLDVIKFNEYNDALLKKGLTDKLDRNSFEGQYIIVSKEAVTLTTNAKKVIRFILNSKDSVIAKEGSVTVL